MPSNWQIQAHLAQWKIAVVLLAIVLFAVVVLI